MKRFIFLSCLASIFFASTILTEAQEPYRFDLTPLGFFEEVPDDPCRSIMPTKSTMANSINDNGQVVGEGTDRTDFGNCGGTDPKQAFIWENRILTGLGFLPGGDPDEKLSWAHDINSGGQVVGYAGCYFCVEGTPDEAYVWENGIMTGLGFLADVQLKFSEAYAINELGEIVGVGVGSSGYREAFKSVYDPAADEWIMTGLGYLPVKGAVYQSSEAVDINNNGQIIGSSFANLGDGTLSQLVIWDNGVIKELEVPPGCFDCRVKSINDFGQIVGYCYVDGEYYMSPIIWEDGIPEFLGEFASGRAFKISNSGQVLVYGSLDLNYQGIYLWDRFNGAIDIKSAFEPIGGWTANSIAFVNSINNNGQIVGMGVDSTDMFNQGFMLTPKEPVDADSDGYRWWEECDDADGTIHPGAAEIKGDGIDQDCNGYELTIDITAVDYDSKRDTLSVEATSFLGQAAELELYGYGPMEWDKRSLVWTINVRDVGGDPGTVTVCGVEGCESAPTGGEPPCVPSPEICNDGIDNDCDGKADCLDKKDCRTDPACL